MTSTIGDMTFSGIHVAFLLHGIAGAQPLPNFHDLLVWQLHKSVGVETIAELRSTDDGAAFLDAIEHNDVWMHQLLDSGPVENGHMVVPFLASLWQADPSLESSDVHRSMATACGLSLGMQGDSADGLAMAERYEWFRDSWDDGLLNIGYGDLTTFERRFLASGLQWTNMTTIDALEHLRDHIQIPRQRYTGAAWYAPYRGHNAFGDSVQGSMYYKPFRGAWDNDAEMAIEVGGVCGALSHVGAASAIASGIPAMTMGEPGHCAYAVQTSPHTWQPAYSLSWKRGLHTNVTRSTWPSLELSQRAMADQSKIRIARDAQRKALWLEAEGDTQNADAAWRSACRTNPLDETLWRDYAQFGGRNDVSGIWWKRFRNDLQAALLPDHPEPTWHLLQNHVYPGLLASAGPTSHRRAFNAYLAALDGWGPVRWNIEGAFNWAWKRAKAPATKQAFLNDTLAQLIDDSALAAPFVAWAQDKSKDSPKLAAAFEKSLLEQAGGEGDGRQAVLKQMARTMLPAAADEHDLETFQRIGRAATALYEPRKSLADSNIKAFDGELLSSGGALRIYKPGNRWDSPEKHWGVLEEHGGWFHTDNGDMPWFEVELPGYGHLSGVVLESRNGHPSRAKGVRVLVSEDREQWTQVGVTPNGHTVQRIDLSDTNPRAKFVRFERDGQCLHYHRILIYGERAS